MSSVCKNFSFVVFGANILYEKGVRIDETLMKMTSGHKFKAIFCSLYLTSQLVSTKNFHYDVTVSQTLNTIISEQFYCFCESDSHATTLAYINNCFLKDGVLLIRTKELSFPLKSVFKGDYEMLSAIILLWSNWRFSWESSFRSFRFFNFFKFKFDRIFFNCLPDSVRPAKVVEMK